MSNDYYHHVRSEISSLLPEKCSVIMEVGCGAGETLKWLKGSCSCSRTIGVEYCPDAAEMAKGNVDEVFCGDIEQLELDVEEGSVDLLLCLDVLEHLRDPWAAMAKLSKYVKKGGAVIASIPNVRHKSVVFPLLFNSKWEYADAGHLDRGHLRFFVRETAVGLLEGAGMAVDLVEETGLGRSKRSQMFNSIIPEVIKGLMVKQFLIRGIKE